MKTTQTSRFRILAFLLFAALTVTAAQAQSQLKITVGGGGTIYRGDLGFRGFNGAHAIVQPEYQFARNFSVAMGFQAGTAPSRT